jgi:biopolymer transport protein ExbD
MAEVDTGGGGKKKKGGSKTKKVSTKIDMTPMVDLAFLLITFFMLATTFSKPVTMEVAMPDKPKDKEDKPPELKESNAFTIVLGKSNFVYYYDGIKDPEMKITTFTADKNDRKTGIRGEIFKRNANKDLVIIIKSSPDAKFKNLVDILDEMAITSSKRYAIVDITDTEKELIRIADDKAKK